MFERRWACGALISGAEVSKETIVSYHHFGLPLVGSDRLTGKDLGQLNQDEPIVKILSTLVIWSWRFRNIKFVQFVKIC